jgi:hypothetical protein
MCHQVGLINYKEYRLTNQILDLFFRGHYFESHKF